MTARTPLERDLTAWLSETAMPRTPDYADEILDQTFRTRQRPRWTFVGRWFRIGADHSSEPAAIRLPPRTIGLLVILALVLAAIAIVAGSRQQLPPPFGLAGNGLLAYNPAGDVALVDPETMESRTIVLEQDAEHDPRWSRDGTHLAFLRETNAGLILVVIDSAGRVKTASEPFAEIDTDSIAWSPDGRTIAVGGDGPRGRAIYLVDAADGTTRDLELNYAFQEMFWRPPDGAQLLFREASPHEGLSIASLADGSIVRIQSRITAATTPLRPLGWTPDGRAILYQPDDAVSGRRTILKDIETGDEMRLSVAFAHVSNDGTRVAGLDDLGRLCIGTIGGRSCDVIPTGVDVEGTFGAGLSWSPDDRWIAISSVPGGAVWLVDPSGAVPPRVVAGSGPGSWQRLALP